MEEANATPAAASSWQGSRKSVPGSSSSSVLQRLIALTLALVVTTTMPAKTDAFAPHRIRITANVDGRSQLILRQGTAQWYHLERAAPGLSGGENLPTYINGHIWYPSWQSSGDNRDCNCTSSALYAPIICQDDQSDDIVEEDNSRFHCDGFVVYLSIIQALGSVAVFQQPSESNDNTVIIEMDNTKLPTANWYDFFFEVPCCIVHKATFQPTTPPSASLNPTASLNPPASLRSQQPSPPAVVHSQQPSVIPSLAPTAARTSSSAPPSSTPSTRPTTVPTPQPVSSTVQPAAPRPSALPTVQPATPHPSAPPTIEPSAKPVPGGATKIHTLLVAVLLTSCAAVSIWMLFCRSGNWRDQFGSSTDSAVPDHDLARPILAQEQQEEVPDEEQEALFTNQPSASSEEDTAQSICPN